MKSESTRLNIGILGGGQLGRMFIQEAMNLNLAVHVLDGDPNSPCRDIATSFTNGDFNDYDTVYQFSQDKDIITIEIEHVNVDALLKLEKEGKKVFPQPSILQIIQDKGLQKEFYKKNNIPTAEYFIVESKKEIGQYFHQFPFMQKLRKGGYDGKGVFPIHFEKDLLLAFDAPSVLEKFIDLKTEISIIVARNESGEIVCYPPVELRYNKSANIVEYLFSPCDLSSEIVAKAEYIAYDLVRKLNIVGLLAIEMFVTKKGEVMVNEIAPRTHNSGHQSIEGNYTSQFAQHIRSILNLPLGSTKILYPSVMINLLGEEGYEGKIIYENLEEILRMEGVYIHLYGKKITKPFRKMGHVTVINQNLEKAKAKAIIVKEKLKIKSTKKYKNDRNYNGK